MHFTIYMWLLIVELYNSCRPLKLHREDIVAVQIWLRLYYSYSWVYVLILHVVLPYIECFYHSANIAIHNIYNYNNHFSKMRFDQYGYLNLNLESIWTTYNYDNFLILTNYLKSFLLSDPSAALVTFVCEHLSGNVGLSDFWLSTLPIWFFPLLIVGLDGWNGVDAKLAEAAKLRWDPTGAIVRSSLASDSTPSILSSSSTS